jgi:hypothetical protein
MHVIGGAAEQTIQVGDLERFSKIDNPLGIWESGSGHFESPIIDIAQDDDVFVRHPVQVGLTSIGDTNDRQIQFFIGGFRFFGRNRLGARQNSRAANGRTGNGCAGGDSRFEKFASTQITFHREAPGEKK